MKSIVEEQFDFAQKIVEQIHANKNYSRADLYFQIKLIKERLDIYESTLLGEDFDKWHELWNITKWGLRK